MSKFKQQNIMTFFSSFLVLVYSMQRLYGKSWWLFVFEITPSSINSMDNQHHWKKSAWAWVEKKAENNVCSFLLFLYLHVKDVFLLLIQPCKKSEKAFTYINFEAVTQKFCRKLSQGTLINLFFFDTFFHTLLYNRPARHSPSYGNLCHYCFCV